jgi:hypothetical protein
LQKEKKEIHRGSIFFVNANAEIKKKYYVPMLQQKNKNRVDA